jgi:hypothetical protein
MPRKTNKNNIKSNNTIEMKGFTKCANGHYYKEELAV